MSRAKIPYRSPARARLAAALAAMALAVAAPLAIYGCGSANGQGPPGTGPLPPWLAQPLPGASASGPPPVEPLVATAADPAAAIFDPAEIVAILDEPRLAEIKAAVGRTAYKGAADGLAKLLSDRPPGPAVEPSYHFQLALLRKRAGDPLAAVRAFDRAAAVEWTLSDYARWMAADLLVQAGEPGEAQARLAAIKPAGAIDEAVALVRAQALADRGKVDQAAPLWSAYLARKPRPRDWQLVALRFARALLNQPSVAHAERAVEVARQVIFESPRGRGAGEARDLEQRALATIPSSRRQRFQRPEAAELAARAGALADAKQGREALAAADKVIKLLADEQPSELGCEAYLARAKALAALRRYAEASDEADLAIHRCEGRSRQVYALFLGGRYALRGGQVAAARRRYAKLEQAFGHHRFADDARLHGAQAALDLGDEAAFSRMLGRMADDYPQGDMVDDGLFTLARARIAQGDWAGAVAPLERAIKQQQRGRPYWSEGRPQYFLGRAKLEIGSTEQGVSLLAQVMRDFPLSYYMGLAYARLADHEPALPARILSQALAAEPRGNFVIPDSEALHQPAFLRAVALVRQGLGKLARAELSTLGVADKTAEPSLLWASALLLARIEAPAESHGVLRASPGTWSTHYPAGVWRAVWEVAFPRPYAKLAEQHAAHNGLSPALVYAIMREESAFKPRAVSHSNAYGLMQLIKPTASRMAKPLGLPSTPEALKRPAVNIPLGCRYLGILSRRFDYDPQLAIPGYNAGPGAPARWVAQRPADDFDLFVERIPYRETRRYTKRVLGSVLAYAFLYGDGMKDPFTQLPLAVKPSTAASP